MFLQVSGDTGFGFPKQPFERFSKLENLLDKDQYEKLQQHLEKQISDCNKLMSWKKTKVFKFDGDLGEKFVLFFSYQPLRLLSQAEKIITRFSAEAKN